MAKRVGRKSKAQTPAPKKDRIKGSSKNPKGSAKDKKSAKKIVFNDKLNQSIKNKVKEYNKENPKKKITIPTAKAVVRRGMGAFSKSYRPTISGGKPNSRQAWGLARLNAFMRKKSGSTTANGVVKSSPIKKVYTQDNDLLEKGGKIVSSGNPKNCGCGSNPCKTYGNGGYLNTYDYQGYILEDIDQQNSGVGYILNGEYTLVARSIYKYDISLWNYYRYIQRINIRLEDCKRFALSLNDVFTNMVCNIKVKQLKGKQRSNASFQILPYSSGNTSSYVGVGEINGTPMEIRTETRMVCCKEGDRGFLYRGKPLPSLDLNDYYSFFTLIHELAHCLDYQFQFAQGKIPVGAHKDYFLTALYKIIKACRDGKLPLATQFDKRALILQQTFQKQSV
jgi:hypothetical protein